MKTGLYHFLVVIQLCFATIALTGLSQADPGKADLQTTVKPGAHPPTCIPQNSAVSVQPAGIEDITDPPAEQVRWTAEWEFREGCLLAWPVNLTAVYEPYCEMVRHLQDVGVVYLLYNDLAAQSTITNLLTSSGISLDNCEWLDIPYYYHWIRDYGPLNVWGESSGRWGIVDNVYTYSTADNAVNSHLRDIWRMDYYETPMAIEGGNLCTDGQGQAFCTSYILEQNPYISEDSLRQIVLDYLGAELTILPEPSISGHLDMSAKLVDPETWIIGKWPPDDPNSQIMDEITATIQSMYASTGNLYSVHLVDQPPRLWNGYWRTYTNAYMQNGKVLMPVYGIPEDSLARAVFQAALPEYEIVPISATGYDLSYGAIHCCTKGVADHRDDYYHDVEIDVVPLTPPVTIPPEGGTFEFAVTLQNHEQDCIRTQCWVEVTLPDSSILSPVYEDYITIAGDEFRHSEFSQDVPGRSPSGQYVYAVYTGERLPRIVNDSTFFYFEKIGDHDETTSDLSGWETHEIIPNGASSLEVAIAENISLVTVYPNPFNPSTVLSFDVQTAGVIHLTIYDISGRIVTEPLNDWEEAGRHDITFDASGLPSGIYIYRLQAGSFTTQGKMVLVK